MDVFQGVHFVRLRCGVRRSKYLAADDDGWGIVLSGQRGAHNTVWAVEHVDAGGDGNAGADASSPAAPPAPAAADGGGEEAGADADAGPFVLLRGAYGRYLLATDHQATTGPSHGVTAVQNANHSHDPTPAGMLWQAVRRRRSFIIRNSTGRYLRANGRYLWWRTAVTVAGDTASTMMQWSIEVVPLRLERPTLIDPLAQLMHRRRMPATEGEVSRVIRYVRADAGGSFTEQDWRTIRVNTNSLMQLRLVLANRLGQNRDALHTTICVRAGNLAQLSPLLIDLPVGNDRIDIVVLSHGTPADNALLYPDVDVSVRSHRRPAPARALELHTTKTNSHRQN